MNVTELRRFLKTDAAIGIKDDKYTLEFPVSDFLNTFELTGLFRYVKDQIERYNSIEPLIPELVLSRDYFVTIEERISYLVEMGKGGHAVSTFVSELNASINRSSHLVIPADSAEANFLISLSKTSAEQTRSAHRFLTTDLNYAEFNGKDRIQGIISAAIFRGQNNPIFNRTQHEKQSFSALKNKVENYVNESDLQLKELFSNGEDLMRQYCDAATEMKDENETKFQKWFEANQKHAKDFTSDVIEERTNIERTYRELLQLQAPAQHWRETAEKLMTEGHMFMRGLIAMLIIGGFALYCLLWKTPEGMLLGFFGGDKVAAIRWSIVFVTFISIVFIGIHSLRKAMFSSFHLARDAQEREKLTMYYLSLIKEGAVGDGDRHLILQSLFSRADSGLLKEDSSPSMPGIFDRVPKSN